MEKQKMCEDSKKRSKREEERQGLDRILYAERQYHLNSNAV